MKVIWTHRDLSCSLRRTAGRVTAFACAGSVQTYFSLQDTKQRVQFASKSPQLKLQMKHNCVRRVYRKASGVRWGRREWAEPCHSQPPLHSPCPGPVPCSQRCRFCTTCGAATDTQHNTKTCMFNNKSRGRNGYKCMKKTPHILNIC